MSPSNSESDRATPLLKERVRALYRHLPRALGGAEEEIHQMRVAGRRLRVALPLLARKARGRRVKRALALLRELTRTAGTSRDLDVGLSLFEERLGSLPVSRERRVLLRRFRSARTRSRSTMAGALLDLDIAKLRRHLRAIQAHKAEGVFGVLLRLREAREAAATLMDDLRLEAGRHDPEALHRLRRRTRRLRYTTEVSDVIRGHETEGPALLKRLQDLLGLSHDSHVLAVWLARQAAVAVAAGDASLAEEARSLEAWFNEKSHELHTAFVEADAPELVRRALESLGPAQEPPAKGGLEFAS